MHWTTELDKSQVIIDPKVAIGLCSKNITSDLQTLLVVLWHCPILNGLVKELNNGQDQFLLVFESHSFGRDKHFKIKSERRRLNDEHNVHRDGDKDNSSNNIANDLGVE
jgi:hypothetical protein